MAEPSPEGRDPREPAAEEGAAGEELAAEARDPAERPARGDGAEDEAAGGEGAEGAEPAGTAEAEEPGEEAAGKPRAEAKPTPPPPDRLDGAVEAMLLASGEAMSAERLRDLLGLPSVVHVREAVERVRARLAGAGLAVELQDVAGGHRVVTRPEYAEYVRRLWRRASADRLSPSLLETLSIVAYKQPVARVEVERIRGVQCGDALRGLLERRLVKVAGRSDQPGRPLLYATTTRFLEVFGLAGLDDLPNAKDLRL
jgi:segregation and condensation protein B